MLENLEKVLKAYSPGFYRRGEVIYKVNDSIDSVFLIRSGCVKVFHKSEENRPEIIFRFCSSGEIIGLKDVLYSEKYSDSCAAVCDSYIYNLPSDIFKSIIEQDFELKLTLMRVLCGKIQTLEKNIFSLMENTSDQRFAQVVDILAETFGLSSDCTLNIKLNTEDLAAITCLSVSYLRKLINKFADRGIISYSDGTLKILNRRKLCEVYKSSNEHHFEN